MLAAMKNLKIRPLVLGLIVITATAILVTTAPFSNKDKAFWSSTITKLNQKISGRSILFIGHAGGGYQGTKYTNSLDALEQNYREGLRFFEVDLMRTKDGKIVCIHGWGDGQMTYEEFRKNQKFNSCDLGSLGQFLADKPDAFVILDTKMDQKQKNTKTERAYDFFSEIAGHLTKDYAIALKRIIPQAYNLAETKQYKADGYPNVIFTLYKAGSKRDYSEACKLKGVAITAPVNWILKGQITVNGEDAPEHCPIFVHPVEEKGELEQAMAIVPQIRGIYTSFLRPEQ